MLCYAILCYALQGAVLELSFLAKLCQPNGHYEQMVLVDPLEGDKLDIPTSHVEDYAHHFRINIKMVLFWFLSLPLK